MYLNYQRVQPNIGDSWELHRWSSLHILQGESSCLSHCDRFYVVYFLRLTHFFTPRYQGSSLQGGSFEVTGNGYITGILAGLVSKSSLDSPDGFSWMALLSSGQYNAFPSNFFNFRRALPPSFHTDQCLMHCYSDLVLTHFASSYNWCSCFWHSLSAVLSSVACRDPSTSFWSFSAELELKCLTFP